MEEELHTLHRSRQRAGGNDDDDEQDKKQRHQNLGCLLDSIADTSYYHRMGKQDEAHRP